MPPKSEPKTEEQKKQEKLQKARERNRFAVLQSRVQQNINELNTFNDDELLLWENYSKKNKSSTSFVEGKMYVMTKPYGERSNIVQFHAFDYITVPSQAPSRAPSQAPSEDDEPEPPKKQNKPEKPILKK